MNLVFPNSGAIGKQFQYVQGDALDMHMFEDKSFDVVFSNSVIEHVGSFENQRRFADEVRRVGKAYWVQTPDC
ncbi:methyltransferase domain-containing protein [Rhodohalobacter sp. 614A]|uniref:methyltransferase domain-containing protein n=1 Tax=Rhodohalobacter sp. 614A TaxID=2908649 RepID=UPI002102E1AC|nr:methyltransferase domain-containing protein [Rhodohalobacter sp. 614A]